MYTITARSAADNFKAVHRCWTRREALLWASCYPDSVADSVTIRRFGVFVARRVAAR